jgi:hypothetical protein
MTRLSAMISVTCLLLALAAIPAAHGQTTPPGGAKIADEQPAQSDDREAIEAGRKWLALIDADQVGVAWDESAKRLKASVARDKFIAEVRRARKPLGKVTSRAPEKFARAHQLPGAPDGDYAIIEYTAKFAGGKTLAEQLVWTLEDGDKWRVAGYYYR